MGTRGGGKGEEPSEVVGDGGRLGRVGAEGVEPWRVCSWYMGVGCWKLWGRDLGLCDGAVAKR